MCAKQNEKIHRRTIQHNLKQRRALDLTKTWESHLASFFEEIQKCIMRLKNIGGYLQLSFQGSSLKVVSRFSKARGWRLPDFLKMNSLTMNFQ